MYLFCIVLEKNGPKLVYLSNYHNMRLDFSAGNIRQENVAVTRELLAVTVDIC